MPTLYDQKVHVAGAGKGQAELKASQTLSLTYSERQRNRLAVMLPDGQAAAIVLPRGQTLQAGDILGCADGHHLKIEAQPEPLLCAQTKSRLDLIRLVYHLANRHVRAMLTEEAVYIEPDPVLRDLMIKLGAQVSSVTMVFEPESGAYSAGHHHHAHGAEDEDAVMGNVGELLSKAAHEGKSHAAR